MNSTLFTDVNSTLFTDAMTLTRPGMARMTAN